MHETAEGQWELPGYAFVRELGSGASGRVVLARRDHDGLDVAVKYLSAELRGDVSFVARFRHEARLLTTIRSEHSAGFLDYVESGDGAAIVMELVNGVSLRAILSAEGPTGPEAALVVLKGSLRGLAAAHAAGIVHRDYKPENVVVQGDGVSKLIDFGIAVRVGAGAVTAGTPAYMAPEQWSAAPASPATDVYAATAVFFECLTGTRPYRAQHVAALAHQHHNAPPPVEEVPLPLQGLVKRGLAKHPADRPASARDFLADLEQAATTAYGPDWERRGRRRLLILAGRLLPLWPCPPQASPEGGTTLARTGLRPAGATRRNRTGVRALAGVLGAGLVVGIAAITLTNGEDPPRLRAQVSPIAAAPPWSVPSATGEPEPTGVGTPSVTPEPELSRSPVAAGSPALNPPPRRPPRRPPAARRAAAPEETRQPTVKAPRPRKSSASKPVEEPPIRIRDTGRPAQPPPQPSPSPTPTPTSPSAEPPPPRRTPTPRGPTPSSTPTRQPSTGSTIS